MPLGVTFFQVPPSSRVTCTSPSSVEAQISPCRCGDSTTQAQVAWTSAPALSRVMSPPDGPWRARSLRLRSGEIFCQLMPSSRVRKTQLPPTYNVEASWAEKTIGKVQAKRYFRSFGAMPVDSSGHTLTSWICRVRWS